MNNPTQQSTQQFSRHVSVPSGQGIRVDKAITIARPLPEVYSFWRHLENLPRFMRHVEFVTVKDGLHSHWGIKTLAGKTLEWDAEIIEQRENEMISWRSTPNADLDNAGSVWFSPVEGGEATLVRLEMKYLPPGGQAGAMLAKMFNDDAEAEIERDLTRLKALLETGTIPPDTGAKPLAAKAKATANRAVVAADHYIRANPWTALVCGLLTGFAIGALLIPGRRTRRLN